MADEKKEVKKVEKKTERKARRDFFKWFREMKSELKKVVWPDGKTTLKNTLTVLAVSLAIGAMIWIFDAVAIQAVRFLINLFRQDNTAAAAAVSSLMGWF